nr:AUGMIN subunit 4 [Ipomoea batatas]
MKIFWDYEAQDCSCSKVEAASYLHRWAKLVIEEIEREEASLREDLYSPARKFAEYYNILGVRIKLGNEKYNKHLQIPNWKIESPTCGNYHIYSKQGYSWLPSSGASKLWNN